MLWAELMKRVFEEDVGCCVNCGGRMELRAVVIRPPATVKVLDGLLASMLWEAKAFSSKNSIQEIVMRYTGKCTWLCDLVRDQCSVPLCI